MDAKGIARIPGLDIPEEKAELASNRNPIVEAEATEAPRNENVVETSVTEWNAGQSPNFDHEIIEY